MLDLMKKRQSFSELLFGYIEQNRKFEVEAHNYGGNKAHGR